MSTRHVLATALTLGVLGAAPAAAGADAELAGAPALRVVDGNRVSLQIATDERLAVRDTRAVVAGRRVGRLVLAGRHGRGYRYVGTLARGDLEVGRKYTLRLTLPGQATTVRQVKLHARRG